MPPITRLSGANPANLLTISRPGLADVVHPRAAYTAWRAANPTATPAQAEAAIQQAIATRWPNPPVQIQVHVFDLVAPNVGVYVADLGESIPAQWWVHP